MKAHKLRGGLWWERRVEEVHKRDPYKDKPRETTLANLSLLCLRAHTLIPISLCSLFLFIFFSMVAYSHKSSLEGFLPCLVFQYLNWKINYLHYVRRFTEKLMNSNFNVLEGEIFHQKTVKRFAVVAHTPFAGERNNFLCQQQKTSRSGSPVFAGATEIFIKFLSCVWDMI